MPTRKPRLGDVFELQVGSAFGYFQYLGRHHEYGHAIRVVPKTFLKAPVVDSSLFHEDYVTFYPVSSAAAQKLIRLIGNLPAPPVPTRLRRAGKRAGGRVENWLIEDVRGEALVQKLSDSELSLPIAAIWNHEFLVTRILECWTPSKSY